MFPAERELFSWGTHSAEKEETLLLIRVQSALHEPATKNKSNNDKQTLLVNKCATNAARCILYNTAEPSQRPVMGEKSSTKLATTFICFFIYLFPISYFYMYINNQRTLDCWKKHVFCKTCLLNLKLYLKTLSNLNILSKS